MLPANLGPLATELDSRETCSRRRGCALMRDTVLLADDGALKGKGDPLHVLLLFLLSRTRRQNDHVCIIMLISWRSLHHLLLFTAVCLEVVFLF